MVAWQSIQAAVDWIEDHLAEEISINLLAQVVNLSPRYFQRLFLQFVGKPVMTYVRLRRLARVSNRLLFNQETILYSCYYYGFHNHETFSRVFKDEYGITPTEFRKNMIPVCHFPKPVLTEEGVYIMDYDVTIEELGEIEFLAIPHLVSMDDSTDFIEDSKMLWEQCCKEKSIERLKAICGTDVIYVLFCNTYSPDTKMVSYDIACVNHLKAASQEFREITLRPSKYAVISGTFNTPMTIGQAYTRFNDIFWGEWIPRTRYKSMIDYDWQEGTASIELYEPPRVDTAGFSIRKWFPIAEKERV